MFKFVHFFQLFNIKIFKVISQWMRKQCDVNAADGVKGAEAMLLCRKLSLATRAAFFFFLYLNVIASRNLSGL